MMSLTSHGRVGLTGLLVFFSLIFSVFAVETVDLNGNDVHDLLQNTTIVAPSPSDRSLVQFNTFIGDTVLGGITYDSARYYINAPSAVRPVVPFSEPLSLNINIPLEYDISTFNGFKFYLYLYDLNQTSGNIKNYLSCSVYLYDENGRVFDSYPLSLKKAFLNNETYFVGTIKSFEHQYLSAIRVYVDFEPYAENLVNTSLRFGIQYPFSFTVFGDSTESGISKIEDKLDSIEELINGDLIYTLNEDNQLKLDILTDNIDFSISEAEDFVSALHNIDSYVPLSDDAISIFSSDHIIGEDSPIKPDNVQLVGSAISSIIGDDGSPVYIMLSLTIVFALVGWILFGKK